MSVVIKDTQRMRKKRQWKFFARITIVALMLIIVPIICHFVRGSFSGDGLLGYCGSIIGSAVAILVASSAYMQSKHIAELEDDRRREQRWKEIHPSLQIEVKRIGNDTYRLNITNHSKNNAISVFLYEYLFWLNVPAEKTVSKKFTTKEDTYQYQYVDPYYFEGLCDDLPKIMWFVYSDIDGNQMQTEFTQRGGVYEPTTTDYL